MRTTQNPVLKAHLPGHPTRLYFIRHGEVETRYHKVFGGSRIDMGLSDLGHQQALAVADWFGGETLDAVYASPMLRVGQTMAPLVTRREIVPVQMHDLREVDFGDWTGYRWEEILEKFGISAFEWLEVLERDGIANGESAATLLGRVKPCLDQILQESAHRSVAVFCHGGIIRVMLALLLELPLARMAHFSIEYGSITAVEIQPEKKHAVEIELLNLQPLQHAVARTA